MIPMGWANFTVESGSVFRWNLRGSSRRTRHRVQRYYHLADNDPLLTSPDVFVSQRGYLPCGFSFRCHWAGLRIDRVPADPNSGEDGSMPESKVMYVVAAELASIIGQSTRASIPTF